MALKNLIGHKSKEETLKDFEAFIKTYSTRDFIYFFSQKSVEIYREHIYGDETTFGCSMTFPLEYFQYGFYYRTGNVMLLAWDIPNMAYLSIINANDYRKNVMTEEMVGIGVNLYREYENKHSGSEYLKNAGLPDIHKFVMGMSYEQFKYRNPEWIYQNFNRNYHILIGSSNIGDNLSLGIYSNKDIYNVTFKECKIKCSWSEKALPVGIDVISPQTILSKLLDSMTENTIEHEGVIDVTLPSSGGIDSIKFNRLLERTYIMAAESCRGLPKAKIYTSYKKFCEWMEADFGYVPVINENTVTLRHRDKLFSSTVVKDLGTGINDYEFSVNDSLIYSSVKVGYDKQDYDSINGRDEFHFTNEFSTGLKIADNTLSLISPYRADAYGIEFLVQKRGEDTTDSDSDNDVFFVDCVEDTSTGTLELNRPYSESQLSGLLSPDTIFNLNYSPRFMLEANKAYIGACTNMLKFTSSDGNSDVSIDGVKETDDFSIPERLFTVSEVEVETGDISAPDDLLGLVSLNNKGRIITGYIKQIKSYIGKAKSSSYTLIVKDIKSNQDGGTFV